MGVFAQMAQSLHKGAPVKHVRREEFGDRIVYWYVDPHTGKLRSSAHHKLPHHAQEVPPEPAQEVGEEVLEAALQKPLPNTEPLGLARALLELLGLNLEVFDHERLERWSNQGLTQVVQDIKPPASEGLARFILQCQRAEWLLALYQELSSRPKKEQASQPADDDGAATGQRAQPRAQGQRADSEAPGPKQPSGRSVPTSKLLALIRMRLHELGLGRPVSKPPTAPKPKAAPKPASPRGSKAASKEAPSEEASKEARSDGSGRKKHLEVGEHVEGSRADEARTLRSVEELAGLDVAQAAKLVTRDKLSPPLGITDAQAAGWTPDGYLLRQTLMGLIDKSPKARRREDLARYFMGLEIITKSLDRCRTGRDVASLLHDIRNLYITPASHEGPTGHRLFQEALASLGPRFGKLLRLRPPASFMMKLDIARHWQSERMTWDSPEVREHFGLSKDKDKDGQDKKTPRQSPFRWDRIVSQSPERAGGAVVQEADAEAMAAEFGLKNVQFGNWISDDDAEHHLKACHGALRDLADVLGVSPQVLSYKGRLALGIGARGKGHAVAHYEPQGKIINLTKFLGGGSLAHEFGHFLDNVLGELYADPNVLGAHGVLGSRSKPKLAARFVTDTLMLRMGDKSRVPSSLAAAAQEVMDAILWSQPEDRVPAQSLAQMEESLSDMRLMMDKLRARREVDEHNKWVPVHNGLARKVVAQQLLHRGQRAPSPMQQGALGLGPYYAMYVELFARGFECFVEDKLHAQGRKNTYLVAGSRADYVTPDGSLPYPAVGSPERARIGRAFEKLLAVMRDGGHLQKALERLFDLGRLAL